MHEQIIAELTDRLPINGHWSTIVAASSWYSSGLEWPVIASGRLGFASGSTRFCTGHIGSGPTKRMAAWVGFNHRLNTYILLIDETLLLTLLRNTYSNTYSTIFSAMLSDPAALDGLCTALGVERIFSNAEPNVVSDYDDNPKTAKNVHRRHRDHRQVRRSL